jgi:asparagine synthase (glutamine-hydrolysing)
VCGITGWVDFGRDLRSERPVIEAMTSTMVNRGPDAGGVWCSTHAAIGHRRLSVIDLVGGEQLMRAALRGSDEDEVVLTFSGEVYNFTELRSELKSLGHEFGTRSDTEVVLRAYLQWGADCVTRLNGMFAFGIWDERRQELRWPVTGSA